jgi:hypothetical protein
MNRGTKTGVPNVPRCNVTMQAKSLTAHGHCQQNRKYDGALSFNFHEVVFGLLCLVSGDCKSLVNQTKNKLIN